MKYHSSFCSRHSANLGRCNYTNQGRFVSMFPIAYYLSHSMLIKRRFDTVVEQFDKSHEVSSVAEILLPQRSNIFNNIYLQVKSS